MKKARILAVAIVTAVGLLAVGATTESAQAYGSTKLNVTYSKVMKNESIQADGILPTAVVRTVKLQRRSGHSWKTLETQQSQPDGFFYFALATAKSGSYRYYAPKSGSRKAIAGTSRTVTVVGQKATAFAAPNQVCANVGTPTVKIAATFSPARRGREVYRTDAGTTYMGMTDSSGHLITDPIAASTEPGKHTITLRADSFNGSAAKSVRVTYTSVLCL